MNSNNTTKRFIVGRKRTPTNLPINLEATKELREKLERFAEKKKEAVQALDKVVLEKKILENWESEQVDVEDIRELVNQANFLELDCSREALDKARDNLRKTETLLGINLRKSNARVREVLEEGEVMKVWEIELQVDEEENPEVVVKQWIVTKDIPGSAQLPSLHSVRLLVEGLGDDLDDDFRAAIAFCEEEKEPQRFTHLVVNYLPLPAGRRYEKEGLAKAEEAESTLKVGIFTTTGFCSNNVENYQTVPWKPLELHLEVWRKRGSARRRRRLRMCRTSICSLWTRRCC